MPFQSVTIAFTSPNAADWHVWKRLWTNARRCMSLNMQSLWAGSRLNMKRKMRLFHMEFLRSAGCSELENWTRICDPTTCTLYLIHRSWRSIRAAGEYRAQLQWHGYQPFGKGTRLSMNACIKQTVRALAKHGWYVSNWFQRPLVPTVWCTSRFAPYLSGCYFAAIENSGGSVENIAHGVVMFAPIGSQVRPCHTKLVWRATYCS